MFRSYMWSTYRTETYSCILTVLIDELQLCSTVRVIHKILCYWTNTTGMTRLKFTRLPNPLRAAQPQFWCPSRAFIMLELFQMGVHKFFPNIWSHLQILRVRRVTRSKCPADGSELWTDRWSSLSFVCCPYLLIHNLVQMGQNDSDWDADVRCWRA